MARMSDLPPKPPMRSRPRMNAAWVCVLTRCKFIRRRALGQEAGQFLVHGLFHLRQRHAGPGGGDDDELARDLARVHVGRYRAGDLLVVDEALVEARRFAGREDVGRQTQVIGCPGRRTAARSRPYRGAPAGRGPGRPGAARRCAWRSRSHAGPAAGRRGCRRNISPPFVSDLIRVRHRRQSRGWHWRRRNTCGTNPSRRRAKRH